MKQNDLTQMNHSRHNAPVAANLVAENLTTTNPRCSANFDLNPTTHGDQTGVPKAPREQKIEKILRDPRSVQKSGTTD